MKRAALLLLPLLAACAAKPAIVPLHGPDFALVPYEPFSRDAAVAIALREWRLFGMPVNDDPPGSRPPAPPDAKPERQEGLWQRVGEYWWLGLDPGVPEARWTGKHDEHGRVFAPDDDADFAWSAAFISYVMRIAGAGGRFPYAAAHHVYIRAAMQGGPQWALTAEPPDSYAPLPGDLICTSRTPRPVRLAALPATAFPAHCDIVAVQAPGMLSVIGGNVDDEVTLKHVPVTAQGTLADANGRVLDTRYPWFVVLRVLYAR